MSFSRIDNEALNTRSLATVGGGSTSPAALPAAALNPAFLQIRVDVRSSAGMLAFHAMSIEQRELGGRVSNCFCSFTNASQSIHRASPPEVSVRSHLIGGMSDDFYALSKVSHCCVIVVVVVYPTPSEEWGHGGRPWSPRSRATLQGLDQRW